MRLTGFHRAIRILHAENRQTWSICFGNEIEVEQLDGMRKQIAASGGTAPSYTALVVKAIAQAIRELQPRYPELNSFITGIPGFRRIHLFDDISAGIAVSREEEGQDLAMVAVVQRPDQIPASEITDQLREASTKPVKEVPYMWNCFYLFRLPSLVQYWMLYVGRTIPKLRRLFRGTFTITTVGKFGVDYQLTLPQAATLQFGFGSVREKPIVRDGQVIPARVMMLTLSFDRRILNGKPCSLLMERIREILNRADFRYESGDHEIYDESSDTSKPSNPVSDESMRRAG